VVAEEAALSSSLSPSSWASSQIEHGRVAVVDPADPAGGEECDSKVVECWECRMFKAIRERRARKVLGPRGLSARGRHQKEREERRKSACCDKDALEGNSEQDLVDDDDMDLEVVEEEEESEDCEEWLPGGRREPGWVCEICDEGGKLVLCDACGKGFHAKCLGIESVETLPDEWFCQGCSANSSCPPAGVDAGSGLRSCQALAGLPAQRRLKRLPELASEDPEVYRKEYNQKFFIWFDRAKACALKGKEVSEYLEQHPMLYKVPSEYKLWIIAKINEGKAAGPRRPAATTFWLQRRDDHKALKYYKGLQELCTALWKFEDKTNFCERGGQEKVEQGGERSSKDSGADSQGADKVGSQMGLASGAVGHDVTHGDVRDLELQIHPTWARCHRLLRDKDEFILKGEEKEEYLRLHPEIATVPPTYTLHIVCKLDPSSAEVKSQCRRHYTFWLQQKTDPRVLKHYSSLAELTAVLGPSERKLTCKYCNKQFASYKTYANHSSASCPVPASTQGTILQPSRMGGGGEAQQERDAERNVLRPIVSDAMIVSDGGTVFLAYGKGSPTSSNAAEKGTGGESAPEPPQNVPSCLPPKKQKVQEPPHMADAPYAAGTSRARAAAAAGQIVQADALDSQDALRIDVYCDGGEGRKTGTLRPHGSHGREWRVHVDGRAGMTLQEFCSFAKVAPVFCAQLVCVHKP
jgi:hypothetical protein